MRGDEEAAVVIVEFSDFECRFCGRYLAETYPQVEDEFVATGRVRYVARHLILASHALALDAARASECAGMQGRFWEMRHQLFVNQGALRLKELREHAEAVQLDTPIYEKCMSEARTHPRVREDLAEAARFQLAATPTFLIGRIQPDGTTATIVKRINGAHPIEVFRATLESVLSVSKAVS